MLIVYSRYAENRLSQHACSTSRGDDDENDDCSLVVRRSRISMYTKLVALSMVLMTMEEEEEEEACYYVACRTSAYIRSI